jgi:hypothetical protein
LGQKKNLNQRHKIGRFYYGTSGHKNGTEHGPILQTDFRRTALAKPPSQRSLSKEDGEKCLVPLLRVSDQRVVTKSRDENLFVVSVPDEDFGVPVILEIVLLENLNQRRGLVGDDERETPNNGSKSGKCPTGLGAAFRSLFECFNDLQDWVALDVAKLKSSRLGRLDLTIVTIVPSLSPRTIESSKNAMSETLSPVFLPPPCSVRSLDIYGRKAKASSMSQRLCSK